MPDWLKDAASQGSLSMLEIAARLGAAVASGLIIAVLYRFCVARRRPDGEVFGTAILLICVLVAMTAMVIDNSVARAFSLVGALAIVRFRTVVEDTRDTAYVIFAVVAGMAAGVGNWHLLAIGVPLVSLVALGRATGSAPAESAGPGKTLLVRLGTGDDPKTALEPAVGRHAASCRLVKAATARQGSAIELTYSVRLKEGADVAALVKELNTVQGVQHAELAEV